MAWEYLAPRDILDMGELASKHVLLSAEDIISKSQHTPKPFSGIYFLIWANEIVYVGQSANIPERLLTHVKDGEKQFDSFSYIIVPPQDLDYLEAEYIIRLSPKYNKSIPVNSTYISKNQAKKRLGMDGWGIKRALKTGHIKRHVIFKREYFEVINEQDFPQ